MRENALSLQPGRVGAELASEARESLISIRESNIDTIGEAEAFHGDRRGHHRQPPRHCLQDLDTGAAASRDRRDAEMRAAIKCGKIIGVLKEFHLMKIGQCFHHGFWIAAGKHQPCFWKAVSYPRQDDVR